MPRKPKTVTQSVTPVQEVVETQAEVQAVVKPPRKPKAKKVVATVSVPETTTTSVAETTVATTSTVEGEHKRVVPTRESVEQEFNDLLTFLEQEITRLRETPQKSKGVKFLRSITKKLKTLKAHSLRVNKQRKTTNRKNTSNSGFLKPVRISKDLAKFTGWNPEELKSRVDVTKFICKYIKDKDLQNPADRRQIQVEKDANLKKLLKYDSKKDSAPLTYYSLQSYLKSHFTPAPTVVVE